jgi:hypothetical protein
MLAKTEAPNPGAIAARVAKSQEHIEVECELSTQRAALEPITAELRELYTKNAGNLERVGRDINRLNERGEVFSKRVNELRAKLRILRAEHGSRVAVALDLVRRDAAARVLDALEELRAAGAVLSATVIEIESRGGETRRLPLPFINDLVEQAQRIAGR